MPDSEIFEEIEFSAETLVQRLRETAFLTRGLRIASSTSAGRARSDEFHYEGGIRDFVALHQRGEGPDPPAHRLLRGRDRRRARVEVAMQWNTSYQESVFTFANNINTTRAARTCRASAPR